MSRAEIVYFLLGFAAGLVLGGDLYGLAHAH